MNISLPLELENYLKQKVGTGKYHSISEIVREALKLLEEQDMLKSYRLNSLRQEIQKGIKSIEQFGTEPLDIEIIKKEARKKWESA